MLEDALNRREFLKFGMPALIFGAMTSAVELHAQQSRRYRFSRNIPLNLDSLPETILRINFSPRPNLEEQKDDLEEMAKSGIINPQFAGYTEQEIVKFEPDINYANALIGEAIDSTNNLFKFLSSRYLRKSEAGFKIPVTTSDVNFGSGDNKQNVIVYLFADIYSHATNTYRANINGKETYRGFTRKERVFGSEGNHSLDASRNEPIFYNTSSPIASLVSAVPIEVLHRAIRKYTIANTNRDLEKAARQNAGTVSQQEQHNSVVFNHLTLEEKFVHALSMLWLRQYNRQAKLGLTQEEMEGQIARYESMDRYRGTGKLADRISQIGIRKAIEMYVHNPDALFKGISN